MLLNSSCRFSSSSPRSLLSQHLFLPYLTPSRRFGLFHNLPCNPPIPHSRRCLTTGSRRGKPDVLRNRGFGSTSSAPSFQRNLNSGRKINYASLACHASTDLLGSLSSSTVIPSTVSENGEIPDLAADSPTSTYVHLPFCRRRCFYCDFPILAVGERTEKTKGYIDSTMSNYVDLLCKEIATTANRSRVDRSPLKTVFFGGGTPSLLPVPLLARIIAELKSQFQILNDAEISIEMDPGTFDRDKLAGFLDCGITRVSLGVQSFQDELLQACGRAHGLREVYDAVEAIQSSGLTNWSLDLIASLPNQTPEQWQHSLQEAISLQSAHVSVYDLQIEEGTLFNRWFKPGQDPLPSDEKSAQFYSMASRTLREAGFDHYEVSNYAKPGFQCRHNLVYWENQPYHAFGLGSTSYFHGRRFSRPRKLKEYATYVQNLEASALHSTDIPQLSFEDKVLDTIMLSLRLARGLNLIEFEARFGSKLTSAVSGALVPFVETGLVEALDAQRRPIPSFMYIRKWKNHESSVAKNPPTSGVIELNGKGGGCFKKVAGEILDRESCECRVASVRLTDPEGFLLSNEVISSIFAALPSSGAV